MWDAISCPAAASASVSEAKYQAGASASVVQGSSPYQGWVRHQSLPQPLAWFALR